MSFVLTRVEEDHLDYFKDLNHIKEVFTKYVEKVPKDGYVVANMKDENIASLTQSLDCTVVSYNDDTQLAQKLKKTLHVLGEHNRENAQAAFKVGKILGLSDDQILKGLSQFKGTWRRQELVGYRETPRDQQTIPVISDYGHHPTEIKATLKAFKEHYPNKRLVVAYQPHQHNRTKKLFKDFVTAFEDADVLILNEIFDVAGREETPDQDVSSQDIVAEIIKRDLKTQKSCFYTKTLEDTQKKICTIIQPDDIVIIMGAGDIDTVARNIVT